MRARACTVIPYVCPHVQTPVSVCVCVEAPLRLRASALIAYLIDLQRLAYLIDLQREEGMSASSFK